MHDSVPLLNTNIYQNYPTEDSNLVPISEDDESSLPPDIPDDSQIASGLFERGGFKRSTIRNSKKKNFMQLRIDMTVCKNNHDSPPQNQRKNDKMMGVPDKIAIVKTPESPLSPAYCHAVKGSEYSQEHNLAKLPPSAALRVLDLPTSTTSPNLTKPLKPKSPNLSPTKSSPNLSDKNAIVSSSSNISLSSAKLEFHPDLSLSDGEEMFEDLSNEITDVLSAEEEEFDRISMCLDLENIETKFEETFNGQTKAAEDDRCKTSHADIDGPESTEIQEKLEKPFSPEIMTDTPEVDQSTESVSQKNQLKQDIAYWERRVSNSAESRVLARNINENFTRSSIQRSTLKRRRTRPSFDRNLGSQSCSTIERTVEMVSGRDDLLEMTSVEKSANTVPYFDGKNYSGGCNRPQSITPPLPAPRKKVAGGRTKILDRGDTNDGPPSPSSHLPKLDTDKRTLGLHPRLVFNIKTWDERKKEKNRSMPTKRLVEWF